MKIWSVFSLVIVFHLAVIGLLLVQPGCQTQSGEKPQPEMTAPQSGSPLAEPQQTQPLDSAFNAGLTPPPSAAGRSLSAPTRPVGLTRDEPDTGLLQPVLEPVQDGLNLPSVKREYTVQKGDNLTLIARREGVELMDLLSANGLNRSSTIFVGQKLMIPGGDSSGATESVEIEHSGKQVVVARGDNLSKIAARTGTTVKVLKTINGLTSDTIFVGQKLTLPESASVGTSASVSPTPQTAQVPRSGQGTYTVQGGDTPGAIARKFGVSTSDLMAANGITDARRLYVGKVLVIPQPGSTVTTAVTSSPVQVQPAERRTQTLTQPTQPVPAEPTAEDSMSILEALEDEDLPFSEVELVGEGDKPGI